MNSLFEKYRPSIVKLLDRGHCLAPIYGVENASEPFELVENDGLPRGNILGGTLFLGMLLFLVFSEVNISKEDETIFYVFLSVLGLVSIHLLLDGVNKYFNPAKRSSLYVDSKRIVHYDSISSKKRTIEWSVIEDAAIKIYRINHSYDCYLLILKKGGRIIHFKISYFIEKNKRYPLKQELFDLLKLKENTFLELREVLGFHIGKKSDNHSGG